MPKYIMLVNFTDQGLKGVQAGQIARDSKKKFGVERKTVWMTFGRHGMSPNFSRSYENWLDGSRLIYCEERRAAVDLRLCS